MNKKEAEALLVRRDIVTMLHSAGSGHPGGSLSITEILVSLYHHISVRPDEPDWEDRDRVVISKGHAAPAIYAVLAEHGYFLKDEFKRLRKLGGKLQGHPDMNKTPGIDACSGSLGQGFSTSIGMALAARVLKKDYHVYAILGDGELQEGIVWEAALAAAHYKLDNLTMIIDYNGLQIDGATDSVMSLGDLPGKMRAFGFEVKEVDGHDMEALDRIWKEAPNGKPVCVIARTTKGKGISFMEGKAEWHGKAITQEEYEAAMKELDEAEQLDKAGQPGEAEQSNPAKQPNQAEQSSKKGGM